MNSPFKYGKVVTGDNFINQYYPHFTKALEAKNIVEIHCKSIIFKDLIMEKQLNSGAARVLESYGVESNIPFMIRK